MTRGRIALLPLAAALAPWITKSWVNPVSFAFFAVTSLLAGVVALLVLVGEDDWALHLSVAGCLIAIGSIVPLAAFVPSAELATLTPAILKLGGAATLLAASYVVIVKHARAEAAESKRRFRAAQAQRKARGLTRAQAVWRYHQRHADPWGLESTDPDIGSVTDGSDNR